MKSEKVKKLENELKDLEHWLDLGLVPKKDIEKHKSEIDILRKRIDEEKDRLMVLRESGDNEEYTAPKRTKDRASALESHTMTDVGASEEVTDAGLEMETEGYESETTVSEDVDETAEEKTVVEEEDDPFSDRNRWRRGILEDPESDDW